MLLQAVAELKEKSEACDASTTCAAPCHKTNFPSQPKSRHSLPRQVRTVLRTMRNGTDKPRHTQNAKQQQQN